VTQTKQPPANPGRFNVRDASLSDLGSEYRPKPVPPKPDCLVADLDLALGQKILDVAQRQAGI
jgi:hypothetical protein